jgi:hypothetical protein
MPADARVTGKSDLNDLEPISKRLNAASDELSKTLESIQQKLNAFSLGVEAWLSVPDFGPLHSEVVGIVDNIRTIRNQELGYGRIGDGWGLIVRTSLYKQNFDAKDSEWLLTTYFPDDVVGQKPLLKASRDTRVRAVWAIPDLINLLHNTAGQVIDAVEEAKKIADSLK